MPGGLGDGQGRDDHHEREEPASQRIREVDASFDQRGKQPGAPRADPVGNRTERNRRDESESPGDRDAEAHLGS